ncbi:YceI family protein [Gaetbulibacter jejuensis]
MKRIVIALLLVSLSILTLNAQNNFAIDTEQSIIHWNSSMLFSFGGHHGTVKFKEGYLESDKGYITGGRFTVDMNTIINTDGEFSQNLVDHLKNDDFFDVEVYPTSTLVITKAKYMDNGKIHMDGNLTIKGITESIRFEALVENEFSMMGNDRKLVTKFKIDRTKWNIMYGAKSIIDIKDYAISDAIEFEVELFY